MRSDGRLFQLTPKVLSLATANFSSNSLSVTLRQAVERVEGRLNEACTAVILDGDDIVFIACAGTTRLLGVGVDVSYRIPAYRSSTGGSSSAVSTTEISRRSWSASSPSR